MGSKEASKSKEELQENSSTAFVNCLYLQSRIKFSASRHSRNKAIAEKQTSKFKASQSVGFAAAVSPRRHSTPLHTLQTCKQSTQVTVQYLHTLYSSANRPIRLVGRVLFRVAYQVWKNEVCKSKISVLGLKSITIIDLNLVPFAIPLQLKTGPVERRSLGVLVGEVVSDPCTCLLYTSPSPRDATLSRMPSSA